MFRELGLVDLLTKLGDRRIDVPSFVSAYDIRQSDGRLSRTMSTRRSVAERLTFSSLTKYRLPSVEVTKELQPSRGLPL